MRGDDGCAVEVIRRAGDEETFVTGGIEHADAAKVGRRGADADFSFAHAVAEWVGDRDDGVVGRMAGGGGTCGVHAPHADIDEHGAERWGIVRGHIGIHFGIATGGDFIGIAEAIAIRIAAAIGIEAFGDFDEIRHAIAIAVLKRRRCGKGVSGCFRRRGAGAGFVGIIIDHAIGEDPRRRDRIVGREAAAGAEAIVNRRAAAVAAEGELNAGAVTACRRRDADVLDAGAKRAVKVHDGELHVLLIDRRAGRGTDGGAHILR